MNEQEARRERERMVRQSQAPPGSPDAPAGSDRATGIDDPTPRAEYRDEPPEPEPITAEDIQRVFSASPDSPSVSGIERATPPGDRTGPFFEIRVTSGLEGSELEWVMREFEVHELYVGADLHQHGCECCGDWAETYAEIRAWPR